MFVQGRYAAAAEALDDPAVRDLYGEHERLLWLLDRGAIALAEDDTELAIEMLEEAERNIEQRHKLNLGDQALEWLWNDTAAPYIAEPYEDMYVNVLKLLAQLEAGHVQGGATVEARRLAGKANVLRDRFLQYTQRLTNRGGSDYSSALRSTASLSSGGAGSSRAGSVSTTNAEGEFVESPLGTYLTAVAFMFSGEPEMQRVAGKRLLDSIRLQQGLVGIIDAAEFEGLDTLAPAEGNLLVVALSGRAPTKDAESIGPIPVFDWPVYFELPVLKGGSAEVGSARVLVAPAAGGTGNSDSSGAPVATADAVAFELPLVEDMRSVAHENHRRQLPLIYARALLRSSIKAGASFAITRGIRQEGKDGWTAVAAVVAGMAAVALTERADLRAWIYLPGMAHAKLVAIDPGDHLVRVEYLSHGGGLAYATPWQRVTIPEGGLATVVEHYWR
ncbi:MAG: hypothetical protein H7Y88_10230 [Phycisphaerales bacterium]|nr:hypothetical protein [Phycisphaerales bacterium]